MTNHLRRLEFLGVVGLVSTGSADASADRARAFRKGLSESGYVEGQNVTVEYHWLDGQSDRLPGLIADDPLSCRSHRHTRRPELTDRTGRGGALGQTRVRHCPFPAVVPA